MRGGTEPEPATEAWFMRMAASMSMRISMPFFGLLVGDLGLLAGLVHRLLSFGNQPGLVEDLGVIADLGRGVGRVERIGEALNIGIRRVRRRQRVERPFVLGGFDGARAAVQHRICRGFHPA